jgi:hypothetical protein
VNRYQAKAGFKYSSREAACRPAMRGEDDRLGNANVLRGGSASVSWHKGRIGTPLRAPASAVGDSHDL